MSKYLSSLDKKQIKNRIESIESKSSAEIVVAISDHAKGFGYITWIYSSVITLFLGFLLYMLGYTPNTLIFSESIVALYFFIYFILSNTSLMSLISPKSLRQKRCKEMAFEQFYKSNINRTSNHKAILIFICLKSRYIRVIADTKIDEIVPKETWQEIVEKFIEKAKEDRVIDGILEIVQSCGDILIKQFPRDTDSKDELSNEVIEV